MNNLRKNLTITLIFLGVTFFITYPLIFGMNKYIYGQFYNTDIRGGLWNFWWGQYALKNGLNYYHCPFLAAPLGIDISQQPVSWIVEYSLGALLMVFSPVFCMNVLIILSFVLCGFFTFLLIRHLTKNDHISLIGALILTFSPFHLNKVMEFSFFYVANWLILYVYCLIKIHEKLSIKYMLYAALAFTMTIAFNPYYGYFAIIFTMGLLMFSFFYQWRDKIKLFVSREGRLTLKKRAGYGGRFLLALGTVFLIVLFLNMPTFLKIAKNLYTQNTSKTVSAAVGYSRSFNYLTAQSARPLSYFLPASTHPLFGEFTKKMFGTIFYGRGSIEQTLYLGWIPLLLSYYAFRQWRYKRLSKNLYPEYTASRENFMIGFFIFSALMAFVFSMPPLLDAGIFKIYLPSFYFYKILPMFRAYARFGLIVIMSVSVLAAYGLKYFFEKLKTNNKQILFTSFIAIAVMFEFINIPPLRVADLGYIPPVYRWLAQEKGDFIVAEYPMSQGSPGEAIENYDYMYYQTYHHKRLINGAIPGTKAFEIKQNILKVNDPQTAEILKQLGVKYVIFHSEPYRTGDYKEAVDIVGVVPTPGSIQNWKLIGTFDTVYVYEIIAEGG